MRFIYLNILLALVVLTSGCVSSANKPSGQLLRSVWNAPRQIAGKIGQLGSKAKHSVCRCKKAHAGCGCKKAQPVCGCQQAPPVVQTGCQSCGSLTCTGSAPYDVALNQHETSQCDCNQHAQEQYILEQYVDDQYVLDQYIEDQCDCHVCSQAQVQVQDSEPMYGYDEAVPPAVTAPYDTLDVPVEPPVPATELEAPQVNVEEGKFDSVPSLSTEPPPASEPAPYFEPRLDTAPPQIDGVDVPALEPQTGFLSPQSLSDPEDHQVAEIEPAEPVTPESATAEQESDADEFSSVLSPTEAESQEHKILQSTKEERVVVLKASPVRNHKINNQSILQRNEAITTNRTDSYGLPVGKQVDFAELPPMDNGTRPRPVSFQRNAAPMPPVKHIENGVPKVEPEVESKVVPKIEDPEDKTTMLEDSNMRVVESTTNRPVDSEPILRMTAVPYEGKSSLGAAIARIKVGKTPLIVRGAYPRDSEYERLARERNEQSTRSVIIPNSSLKTIDR